MFGTDKLPIKLNQFTIGRILGGKDHLLIFDLHSPQAALFTPELQPAGRQKLGEIRQIECLYWDEECSAVLITDPVAKKILRYQLDTGNRQKFLTPVDGGELNSRAQIIAMARRGNEYLLLDKENCLLRIYSRELAETGTLASRLGYLRGGQDMRRLGFEYPEDMIIAGDQVVIADSGNKRLVFLNDKLEFLQAMDLDNDPYKILACDGDLVWVSHFTPSASVVSRCYGFLREYPLSGGIDFASFQFAAGRILAAPEDKQLKYIWQVSLPKASPDEILNGTGNESVLLQLATERQDLAQLINIISHHPEWLHRVTPWLDSSDPFAGSVPPALTPILRERCDGILAENGRLEKEIVAGAIEFVKIAKSVTVSSDCEQAEIFRENSAFELSARLSHYRKNLEAVAEIRVFYQETFPNSAWRSFFSRVLAGAVREIQALSGKLDECLDLYHEENLVIAVSRFALLRNMMLILFPEEKIPAREKFSASDLLYFLNNFYYQVSLLYLRRKENKKFSEFAEMEIKMHADKNDVLKEYIGKLIQLDELDRAWDWLQKIPDQNKENVNWLYFQWYNRKKLPEKAFGHLRREIDLYPHRIDLIPKLVRLSRFFQGDITSYIQRIIDQSGQAIDACLTLARAFLAKGDQETAWKFLNQELEKFPENNSAIIEALQLLLVQEKPDLVKMKYYLDRLKKDDDQYTLLKCRAGFMLEDYDGTWIYLQRPGLIDVDDAIARNRLYLFGCLNHLSLTPAFLDQVIQLKNQLAIPAFKQELEIYISFNKYFRNVYAEITADRFPNEIYLTSQSTGLLAFKHFFAEICRLHAAGHDFEALDLTEQLLKFHPGNSQIFALLDSFVTKP